MTGTTELDKVGASVAAQVLAIGKAQDGLEKRSESAREQLAQVWAALEAGTAVNGCTSKKAWAARWKVSARTCQYILKGKRDRSAEIRKRDANHVVRLKEGMVVGFQGLKYVVRNIGVGGDSTLTLTAEIKESKPLEPAPY